MSEITTNKSVNLGQLSHELGRIGLSVVGPDEEGRSIISADVTQKVLEDAVGRHIADDAWVNPEPEPESEAARIRRQTREQLIPLLTRAQEIQNGSTSVDFTAREVQTILAAFVLNSDRMI